ncbi:MAG: tetratricopeptide repeat protein [Prevotellaceae bacterium]|jgi:tetratricopeptide (TPR) repeat protein|nr:tetratricopeptide repeat protein [Prevotellaceae bacterium]
MKHIITTLFIIHYSLFIANAQVDSVFQQKIADDELRDSTAQQRFDFHYYEGERLKQHSDYRAAIQQFTQCLEIDSMNAAAWFELSKMYQFTNQYSLAYNSLLKAVKIAPKNAFYKEVQAAYCINSKDYEQAILIFESLAKQNIGKVSYLYNLYDLYVAKKLNNKILATLNKIETLNGISEEVTMMKVEFFTKQKQQKKAIKEIKKLIAKYPAETNYQAVLGQYYMMIGDTINGLQTFNSVLAKRQNDGYALMQLFYYYHNNGNDEKANDCLTKAMSDKNVDIAEKLEPFARYVNSLIDKKQYSVAEKLFVELLKNYPNESEVYSMYAAYLFDIKNFTQAEENLLTAISLAPDGEENWETLAEIYIRNDSTEKLAKLAEDAEKIFPKNSRWAYYRISTLFKFEKKSEAMALIDAYVESFDDKENNFKSLILNIKADELMQQKRYSEAFAAYEKSIEFNSGNISAMNNYAYFLSECGLELRKAELMSGKTIQAEPQNATFLDTYAWILFKEGDFRSAKFYIERALNYAANAELLEHYGDILFHTNEPEKAVEQWVKSKVAGNESEILKKKIDEKKYFPKEEECK